MEALSAFDTDAVLRGEEGFRPDGRTVDSARDELRGHNGQRDEGRDALYAALLCRDLVTARMVDAVYIAVELDRICARTERNRDADAPWPIAQFAYGLA